MKYIKSFDQWINEDFAMVGTAPGGNVVGAGPVVAPTATQTGSGDQWPSLGAPSTKNTCLICGKKYNKKKRCKCKDKEKEQN